MLSRLRFVASNLFPLELLLKTDLNIARRN
jgi:hypothetical protein